MFGRSAALIGAALLACTPLLASEAHQAKTDAVLLACAVAAQGALARFYLAARRGHPAPGWRMALLFWVAQVAAILVKGPIVPMVSALTIAALAVADRRARQPWRWLRGLRPMPGVALVIVLVAPWAIAVSIATQGQFIAQAAGHDFLAKLTGGQESHAAPPGAYLLLATATLWPASVFIVPGFVRAIRGRAEAAFRFCLAWAVPAWIVFELVPTKLPHYVLPLVPALTLLAGACVAGDDALFRRGWVRLYALVCGLVGVALAVAGVIAPIEFGQGFAFVSVPMALAALAGGIAPAVLIQRGRVRAAAGAALVATALAFAFLFGGVMPDLDKLWVSPRVASLVPPAHPVAAAGFHEPSLVFALGTATKLTDGAGAADFLSAIPGAVAVVEAAAEPSFQARLVASGHSGHKLGEVDGFNYTRGRPAALSVWMLGDAP
jgi:4-amino-4-deoxy-L-arabinose transferase-like glycosyltransferase